MEHSLIWKLLNSISYSIERNDQVAVVTLIRADGIVEKALLSGSAELIGGSIDEATIEGIKYILPLLFADQCGVFVGNVSRVEGGEVEVIIEVIRSKRRMLVFGAGHVGQAVAIIGSLVGYNVSVYDDRDEFLDRARFPNSRIELHCCDFSKLKDVVGKLKGAIIVIVTRGHQYDEECLRVVADSAASYVGMIGSKRRVMSIFKRLQDSGVEKTNLDRVHAPIGLVIGAVTPQEIAVAIVGEVIRELNSNREEGDSPK